MPKPLIYLIESLKFEAALVFYVLAAVAIYQLLPVTLHTPEQRRAPAALTGMPYAVLHPYDPALAAEQVAKLNAENHTAGPVTVPGDSIWPLHGKVTTEFGAPDYPFESSHSGMDISSARPAGQSQVVAFHAGVVSSVIFSSGGLGNHITIDHGGGLTSVYGHLFSVSTHIGQQIRAGDVIGTEGSTGASTGPHLHFEIRQNNVPQNPRRYVAGSP